MSETKSSQKYNNQLILKAEKEIRHVRDRIKKTTDHTGSQGPSAFSKGNSYFDMDNFPKSPDRENLKTENVRRQSQKPKSCSYDVTSKFSRQIGPQTASNAEKEKENYNNTASQRYPNKTIRPSATEINWTNRIEQARSRQSSKKNLVANVTGFNDEEKRIISAVDTKSIPSKKNLAQLNAQHSQGAKDRPEGQKSKSGQDLAYFKLKTPKRENDKVSGLNSLNSIEK